MFTHISYLQQLQFQAIALTCHNWRHDDKIHTNDTGWERSHNGNYIEHRGNDLETNMNILKAQIVYKVEWYDTDVYSLPPGECGCDFKSVIFRCCAVISIKC